MINLWSIQHLVYIVRQSMFLPLLWKILSCQKSCSDSTTPFVLPDRGCATFMSLFLYSLAQYLAFAELGWATWRLAIGPFMYGIKILLARKRGKWCQIRNRAEQSNRLRREFRATPQTFGTWLAKQGCLWASYSSHPGIWMLRMCWLLSPCPTSGLFSERAFCFALRLQITLEI